MRDSRVLIIGAGIGGLTAALSLAQHGQKVRVFEQAPELGEVGAGLSITPNAGRALVHLGLGETLAAIGNTPTVGALKHFSTGEVLVPLGQDESREKYGVPLYHVHRADLHAMLLDALRALDPDAVEVNRSLTSMQQSQHGVVVHFQDGSTAQGDWLVGCDGIHSTTRELLFGPDRPNFTSYVAWRGLVPGNTVVPGSLDPPLCMSMAPNRMFMRYPLRDGAVINYVAVARRDTWSEEGWSVRSEVAEVLEEFADFERPIRDLIALTPPDLCFKWGLFDRDPLPTWHHEQATLLGDAAHAMPPFTGQGAVMAIEDGVVLGRATENATDPRDALRRYERARHKRVTDALIMSRARSELYFANEPSEQVRALGAGMAELRTLYDYDAGVVPV